MITADMPMYVNSTYLYQPLYKEYNINMSYWDSKQNIIFRTADIYN